MPSTSTNLSRIIEGHTCHIKEYPFMVLIALNQLYKPLCGGTILTPIWILTAGHCLFTYPQNYIVFSGLQSLNEISTAQKTLVSAYYIHPEYKISNEHDICLLKLNERLYGNGIVSLSFEDFTPKFVKSCSKSTVMGYGMQTAVDLDDTLIGTVRHDGNLKCAFMSVLEDWVCDKFVPRKFSELCAMDLSPQGQDCCFGDSGGPIICNDKQIGIISKGFGCGLGYPVKFTKINLYKDFIEDTMANSSLGDLKLKAVVALCFIFVCSI